MKRAGANDLERYLRSGRDAVLGWFGRIDAEIYGAIFKLQASRGWGGATAIVGVHHGKDAIALCLALRGNERAYCIDIFEDQEHNLDRSGSGNRASFERNLRAFGIDPARVVIRQDSSLDVRPAEIEAAVGKVRFFSVDGGHWMEIVRNDLALAEACLAEHGVIALDDFHRPDWPDVSAGYFAWFAARETPIVPFAIGFNKLYLCREPDAAAYGNALENDRFLTPFLVKVAKFQGYDLPVFSQALIPEYSLKRKALYALRLIGPDLFRTFVTARGARHRTDPAVT